MKIKQFLSLKNIKTILTIIFFISTCLFTQGFYKATTGFVASKFENAHFILTMVVAYVVPVFCFLFYFCNYYVKRCNRLFTLIYSPIITILSVGVLINIFQNIEVYARNNFLGVYQTIPSLLFGFPFDCIIVHIGLIAVQAINVLSVLKPELKVAKVREELLETGRLNITVLEYIPYALLTILAGLFAGLFVCGLSAIENVLYDAKYVYLLLWYLVPCLSLICIVLKFENNFKKDSSKLAHLLSLVGLNVVFLVLFFVFEAIDPDFIVRVGKPLLPITFSVSMRIEIFVMMGTQGLGSLILLVKSALIIFKKKATN